MNGDDLNAQLEKLSTRIFAMVEEAFETSDVDVSLKELTFTVQQEKTSLNKMRAEENFPITAGIKESKCRKNSQGQIVCESVKR